MYWTCEAHCWTLLAEYEVLYQESSRKSLSDSLVP